jgi:hypothetical protein
MPEGRDGLARDPEGARSDRNTPPQDQHWDSDWSAEGFDAVPPPPRVGRGHRTTAENMAGRELLTSYGAHMEHLTEAAMSATVGRSATHPGAAEEVSKRNSQLEYMKEWGKTRYIGDEYVEEGTEGQFVGEEAGGKLGRFATSSGANASTMVADVFGGFGGGLGSSSQGATGPSPHTTKSAAETFPAAKDLPPGPPPMPSGLKPMTGQPKPSLG